MIVWVNGCFDVLHIGHIELLRYAKNLGDKLIVGIDSDERVKELKGDTRPFNNQFDRTEMLRAIKYVDQVVIFNSEKELIASIDKYNVHTMVVGDDYKDKEVIGSENAKKVMFFQKLDNYSTTHILDYENICNSKK